MIKTYNQIIKKKLRCFKIEFNYCWAKSIQLWIDAKCVPHKGEHCGQRDSLGLNNERANATVKALEKSGPTPHFTEFTFSPEERTQFCLSHCCHFHATFSGLFVFKLEKLKRTIMSNSTFTITVLNYYRLKD